MLRRDLFSLPLLAVGNNLPGAGSPRVAAFIYEVKSYGGVPDGKTLNTNAIQHAIDAASGAGGGTVYLGPGTYLTGSLELKSRVTLYLEAGAILLGSPRIADYIENPGPDSDADASGRHLLYAHQAEDIRICGGGVIDGQGQRFWRKVQRAAVSSDNLWKDVITFDYAPVEGNRRPSPMVCFAECRSVHLSDVTLRNSAGWTLRLAASDSITVSRVRIQNPAYGVNTDGIDITASQNVVISQCDIKTGDDAICLKSENPYSDSVLTRNIIVANCTLTTACNGFKIGTGTAGRFENIVFSDSVIYSDASSPLNARLISGISLEMVDGGAIDGVNISNIQMANVRTPIFIRLGTRKAQPGTSLRNVLICGVNASGAILTSSITGVPTARISDITISECRIRSVEAGQKAWQTRPVPDKEAAYPEARMFGRLPSSGLYVRHVNRLRVRNVEFLSDSLDERPTILCDDADDVVLDGVQATVTPAAPMIAVHNVQDLFVTGIRLNPEGRTLLSVSGSRSKSIQLSSIATRPGQTQVVYRDGASESSS